MRASAFAMTVMFVASAQLPAAVNPCANPQDPGTMSMCVGRDFVEIDKELNATYKKVVKRVGEEVDTKKLLIAAERAWIAYRDTECEFVSVNSVGGTIHPMAVNTCKTAMTKDRVAQLKAYLDCKNPSDLSCPLSLPAQ